MAGITGKPEMFVTADGREFESLEDAERWDSISVAQTDYEVARGRFMNALAENVRTADGHLFKRMRNYWRVREVHRGMAWLEEISAYEHPIELHGWDGIRTDRVQIRVQLTHRTGKSSHDWVAVDIDSLYQSRKAAEGALAESQKETLENWRLEIAASPGGRP